MLAVATPASGSPLADLRRQVAEQERQIKQLEIENARLRYMLTEAEHHRGDPLYGTTLSVKPGQGRNTGKSDSGKSEDTQAPEDEPDLHVVRAGDTLSAIASARGLKVEALAALNQLADPSLIRPGQRLRLPAKPAPAADPEVAPRSPDRPLKHMVRAGENLYRISLRYETDLEELLAANPGVDPERLSVGQQLRLPDSTPMLAEHR